MNKNESGNIENSTSENVSDNTAVYAALSASAQDLLKNLQETLNEEKWTRATLGNYSAGQFKELDIILKKAREEKVVDELKKSCDEHLSHTRNSIIALYLSGMISLSRQIIDDAAIINLVSIFQDNNKWSVVKFLCERILDFGESKFALRTLADCYKNDNEEGEVFGIWERLVKVDFEEADITKSLAEHFEKSGKKDEAVDYYKKALHRYINKGSYPNVREIWEKLLNLYLDDIDFFLNIQKKIAKNINEDKAIALLNELYSKYKSIDINVAINILKIVLEYDEKDNHARKEIIECFRKKYKGHSQLEEYIRVSNLSQNYRDVHKAIMDFEKHIAFDKGNFVFHRTWGVGRISGILGDDINIDFSKKRGHSMALKMAVEALQTLSRDHIWVLKATNKKDELRNKIKSKEGNENIIWILKIIIKSFPGTCDMKRIKAELAPSLLSSGEWSSWSTKARDILKTNPEFGVNPDNNEIFTVRDRPISVTEKLYNEFTAIENFFSRVQAMRDYVHNKNADPNSEYFTEMLSYFTSYINQIDLVPGEIAASSYLLINELALNENYTHLKTAVSLPFNKLYTSFSDTASLYRSIKDAKLKEAFLKSIREYIADWSSEYVKLFPVALVKSIIENLEAAGHKNKLTVMCNNCFDNPRENREAVIWLYKNCVGKDWFKAADIGYEKQLIVLIHILDITDRDIENQRDPVENRKINKHAYNILFTEGAISSYIDNADEEAIIRVFTFINDVKGLDPQDKINLRSKILDIHPDFKFFGETEKKVTRGLIITFAKYEDIKRQLSRIIEVDIPANARELEYAVSKGDLSENAEYKAAREKRDQLSTQMAKLKEDIERAHLFDPNSINTSKVSFGTKVVLNNELTRQKEEFIIMGPWESDPNNKIISYLSPFGSAIMNSTTGEKVEFVINDEKFSYLVGEITPAEIK